VKFRLIFYFFTNNVKFPNR